MSDASPAPKRARLSGSESQASNVVPPQIYRVRVTLPSYLGFRVFDVPEFASLHELHLHIGEAFNRDPDSHCYIFEHPLPAHVVGLYSPKGPKTDKASVTFLCKACCVPTEGLKLPELKRALSAVKKDLNAKHEAICVSWARFDRLRPGEIQAYRVEDENQMHDRPLAPYKRFGSRETKMRFLKPGDLLKYEFDFGASWQHIVAVESARYATPQDARKGIQLVESNGLSEPPDDYW
jgi:uncharacterized protein YegP (UPF0339 family)